jgi:hypothetical protein
LVLWGLSVYEEVCGYHQFGTVQRATWTNGRLEDHLSSNDWDLAPLRAPQILPESIFGHLYGLRDCNRIHPAAGFPPLLISGLEGGNGTLLYELCHAALDCVACVWHVFKFVGLGSTCAVSESNLFDSDVNYCPQFRDGFHLENCERGILLMSACSILPNLTGSKF